MRLLIPNFALQYNTRRSVAHKKRTAKFAFGCGLPQGLTPHVSIFSRHAALWADFAWPRRSETNAKSGLNLALAGFVLNAISFVGLLNADQTFSEYCTKAYLENAQCPSAICQLQCEDATMQKECPKVCLPKDCKDISAENCPKEFCRTQTDCSQKTTCHPLNNIEQIPECGLLAYSGQDVECCKGLVKRCGFDYLDGKCNMEGKNTAYHLPICIPCGDGVCTNFENHCNCPEDCKKVIIPLE